MGGLVLPQIIQRLTTATEQQQQQRQMLLLLLDVVQRMNRSNAVSTSCPGRTYVNVTIVIIEYCCCSSVIYFKMCEEGRIMQE